MKLKKGGKVIIISSSTRTWGIKWVYPL